MFDHKKATELVLTSLVADTYSLGPHWIYDAKELDALDIDWQQLNDAKAKWHEGKHAGDFTHYGDQTLWLYEFLQDKNHFDVGEYIAFWQIKMATYNGYIDGAMKGTLENIQAGITPTGSSSTDTSIVGRIAPLLLVSDSRQGFLENVVLFVSSTHNANEIIAPATFFADLLVEVLSGKDVIQAISQLKPHYNTNIQRYVEQGIRSSSDDTIDAIREFGPACGIEGGFPSIIHLLTKYDKLEDMLIANAKAGGDTSGRAMIAAIIFMAPSTRTINDIPSAWLRLNTTLV